MIYFHHKRATVSCESGVRTGVRTQCRARGQSEATGIILLDAPRWSPLNVVQVDGCGGEMVCTHQLRYPPSRVARFRRTPLAITRETNDTAPRRVGSARSCGCQTFDLATRYGVSQLVIDGLRKVINKRRESGPKARASKERSHYTKIDNLEASPRIYAFSEGGSLVALAVPLQLASAARLQQAFPRAKNERP